MAGDTKQCNIAARIYSKTNQDRITQKPNCGVTDMIKGPLNPPKKSNFDCVISNPKESPSGAKPFHNFRLIHNVKLRQGKQTSSKSWKSEVSFQCDNWHFTFAEKELLAVWLSTECFPSKGKVQTPTVKGCHKQGNHSGLLTSHDAYKTQYHSAS